MGNRTLFEKIWDSHVVHREDDGTCLIYIDAHLIHEVTTPQAFEGLKMNGRDVRRPDLTYGVMDHNVPTGDRSVGRAVYETEAVESREQMDTFEANCKEFGIEYFDIFDPRQGIVHAMGPEQGITQPGKTIVCGDSHTSTNGAFGAFAFGIGTSEVEHVLATQTLLQKKPKTMRVTVDGELAPGITAKDIILGIIGKIGTAGGTGHVIEYAGSTIRGLSMEGRMTICNMSIEAGARAGMIAPDETTFEYVHGRPYAPKDEDWDKAVAHWKTLYSDEGAEFDTEVHLNAADIPPLVTWGTTPEDVAPIDGIVPAPEDFADEGKREAVVQMLKYMDLKPGMRMQDIEIDRVFLGSCTNARIEDLREAAKVAKGNKVANSVKAMVVPASSIVKKQAEQEGLDQIFIDAGFEWREAGCSMCLGMNSDTLSPGERCASTSNRNFEGRQGRGGRTHLLSPAMAAAAAITGHLTDIRTFKAQ